MGGPSTGTMHQSLQRGIGGQPGVVSSGHSGVFFPVI